MELEMVICPVCHKPFPKRRKELGYNYCISCSTEKKKVALVQGIGEGEGGDGIFTDISIVSAEEALVLEKTRKSERIFNGAGEDLDMSTFEELDQKELSEGELASLRKINFGSEDESGMSEKVMDEIEEYCEPEEEEQDYDQAEEEE